MSKYDLKIFTTCDCNQNCSYCFERDVNNINSRLNNHLINSIVGYVENNYNEIDNIALMGGESYVHINDLTMLVAKLKDLLIAHDIGLIIYTNGTIFNKEIESFYKLLSDINCMIWITDHNFEIGNNINTINQHIKYLDNHNISYSIKLIVDKYILNNFKLVRDYYIRNGSKLDKIDLFLAYYDKVYPIENNDFNQVFNYINDNIFDSDILEKMEDLFRTRRILEFGNKHLDLCGAGVTELTFSNNGLVYGCEHMFTATDYDPVKIEDMGKDIIESRSKHSQLNYLNNRYTIFPKKCYNCEVSCSCSQCRYNHSTNVDVYSDKPDGICNFTKLYHEWNLQISEMILKKLIKNSEELNKKLLTELIILQTEVINNE